MEKQNSILKWDLICKFMFVVDLPPKSAEWRVRFSRHCFGPSSTLPVLPLTIHLSDFPLFWHENLYASKQNNFIESWLLIHLWAHWIGVVRLWRNPQIFEFRLKIQLRWPCIGLWLVKYDIVCILWGINVWALWTFLIILLYRTWIRS